MSDLRRISQRFADFVEYVRSSFWAIPGLLILISIAVAVLNLWVDTQVVPALAQKNGSWFHNTEIASIRTLLSTMAAAILGVAGVTFSITIASLTLASQQFGPRLIRTFMRNRFIQTVLGFFVATFVYCMLSMQLSSILANDSYVPISTLLTILILTIVDLVLLVLFIHHICVSIQVDSVIAEVSNEMKSRVTTLLPESDENTMDPSPQLVAEFNSNFADNAQKTLSTQDGYVTSFDYDGLLAYAAEQHVLIRVLQRAGDYVLVGSPLYEHISEDAAANPSISMEKSFCIVGFTRTPLQDLEYTIRQLVEIALRALSPGINDPFTAITCLDRLGSLINLVASRQIAPELIMDEHDNPRMLVKTTSYDGIVQTAFDQIRQNARSNVDVLIRMLEILDQLSLLVPDRQKTTILLHQADQIIEKVDLANFTKSDHSTIMDRYNMIKETIANREEQRSLMPSANYRQD